MATGKRVVFSGINIYTIRRGKFVASQVNWDTLGLLQKVGTVRLRLRVPASPSRAPNRLADRRRRSQSLSQ